MVDLVKVKDMSVHVATPSERVATDWAGVRLRFPHYRDLGGFLYITNPKLLSLLSNETCLSSARF